MNIVTQTAENSKKTYKIIIKTVIDVKYDDFLSARINVKRLYSTV